MTCVLEAPVCPVRSPKPLESLQYELPLGLWLHHQVAWGVGAVHSEECGEPAGSEAHLTPNPRLFLSTPSPKTTGLALALCCCRDWTPAPPWAPVAQSLPSPCPPSHRDLATRLLSVDSGS